MYRIENKEGSFSVVADRDICADEVVIMEKASVSFDLISYYQAQPDREARDMELLDYELLAAHILSHYEVHRLGMQQLYPRKLMQAPLALKEQMTRLPLFRRLIDSESQFNSIKQLDSSLMILIMLKCRFNHFNSGYTASDAKVFLCIYPTSSLLNHSCNPSLCSQMHVLDNIPRLTWHAQRSISKGEELTIGYLPAAQLKHMTLAQRRAELYASWKFICKCKLCED